MAPLLPEGPALLSRSSTVTSVSKVSSCNRNPPALWPAALGTEGAAGTVSPTPVRTRTPSQGGERRGGRRPARLPRAHRHSAHVGEGCLQGPPSFGCRWRPPCGPLTNLPLGNGGGWLSCSGPSCPPPAPACSGAAAGEPAHPSPGPSGSAGAGRVLASLAGSLGSHGTTS